MARALAGIWSASWQAGERPGPADGRGVFMTLGMVRQLFERLLGKPGPLPRPGWSGRRITGGSWQPAGGPGQAPGPMGPGSGLADWLTQTVAYHH